jgi:hypothetical protein
VRIEGEDLEITWKYSGYCRAGRESAMDFSIDSDQRTAFKDLNCVEYDVGLDLEMAHRVYPVLIGSDGFSKKVSVPFLEPLKCTLQGLHYYICKSLKTVAAT